MSFDIHTFLDDIVGKQLPELAMNNAYFGAGIIAGAIEFLGACMDNEPLAAEGKSAARFCNALNELFPSEYHQFSRSAPFDKNRRPVHDLYSALRCGMAHTLRPRGVLLTGTTEEAIRDNNTHLEILHRGGKDYPLIVVDVFVADFKLAVANLQIRLRSVPLPEKLKGDVLTVWKS
jgi:hypothetical protein